MGTVWERLTACESFLALPYHIYFLFKGGRQILKYLFDVHFLYYIFRVGFAFLILLGQEVTKGEKKEAHFGPQSLLRIWVVPADDI